MTPQLRVLKAVCRGARTAKHIAQASHVEPSTVYTHLRRLQRKGAIVSRKVNNGANRKEYHPKDSGCLLAAIWFMPSAPAPVRNFDKGGDSYGARQEETHAEQTLLSATQIGAPLDGGAL